MPEPEFCLIHGYDFMEKFGRFEVCAKCVDEKSEGTSGQNEEPDDPDYHNYIWHSDDAAS